MDEMMAFDAPVTEMDCEEVEEDPFGFGMELGKFRTLQTVSKLKKRIGQRTLSDTILTMMLVIGSVRLQKKDDVWAQAQVSRSSKTYTRNPFSMICGTSLIELSSKSHTRDLLEMLH